MSDKLKTISPMNTKNKRLSMIDWETPPVTIEDINNNFPCSNKIKETNTNIIEGSHSRCSSSLSAIDSIDFLHNFQQLWSKLDVVKNHGNQGRNGLDSFAFLALNFGKLEENRCHQLALLRKKKEFCMEIAFNASYHVNSTLSETMVRYGQIFIDNYIKSSIIIAHEYKSLGNSLSAFSNQQKEIYKQLNLKTTRIDKQLESQLHILSRSKAKYEKTYKEVQRAIQNHQDTNAKLKLSIGTGNTISYDLVHKLKQKAKDGIYFLSETEKIHSEVVNDTRKLQLRVYEEKKKISKRYQALHQVRGEKIKQALNQLAKIHKEQSDYLSTLFLEMGNMSNHINLEADFSNFIKTVQPQAAYDIGSDLVKFEPFPKLSIDEAIEEDKDLGAILENHTNDNSKLFGVTGDTLYDCSTSKEISNNAFGFLQDINSMAKSA